MAVLCYTLEQMLGYFCAMEALSYQSCPIKIKSNDSYVVVLDIELAIIGHCFLDAMRIIVPRHNLGILGFPMLACPKVQNLSDEHETQHPTPLPDLPLIPIYR